MNNKELADEWLSRAEIFSPNTRNAVRSFARWLDFRSALESPTITSDADKAAALPSQATDTPAADNSGRVLIRVMCDCAQGDKCPQGRTSMGCNCVILMNEPTEQRIANSYIQKALNKS